MLHRDAIAALAREGVRSRQALTIERASVAALAPLLALAAWMAVALVGAQDAAPPLLGTLMGIAAIVGLLWLTLRAMARWRPPTPEEARARLNRDAGLDRGALEALGDSPAVLDAGGLALWRREQERTVEKVSRAKAAPVRLDFTTDDPWRLRFIVPALLVAAALFAGADGPDRLARAFYPDPGPLVGDKPMAIEAWITPASYTGGAPVSLSDRIGDRVETPPSPEATVRVTGPAAAPWLQFDGPGGKRRIRFEKAADGAYEAKLALPSGGTLRVIRFHTKARWRIAPTPDAKPAGAFVEAPKVGEGDKITFSWKASDDYGVGALALRLTPVDPPVGLREAKPIDTAIDAPAGDPRAAEGEASIDLSAHAYAGMKVNAQLVVRDALGQEGMSEVAQLKLPEKIFLQPLARVAIEIRKIILHERRAYAKAPDVRSPRISGVADLFGIRTDDEDPRITRAPAAIRRAGRMLDATTMAPQDGYFRDAAVFAGFRFARATLDTAREIEDTNDAADILWNVAMRAEYGDSADAKRALEEAQRRLADAISKGASKEEIARLADALQQATQNYLKALVQEAIRDGKRQENAEDAQEQNSLSLNDIQKMMDEVQRRAEAGDTAGAQALLQQLSQLLNNMEIKLASRNDGDSSGEEGEPTELEQAVQGLSEQIGKQRQLRDETAQEEQNQQDANQSAQERQQNSQQQQELGERQEQLGQDMRAAQQKAQGAGGEEGGQELSDAGEAMDRAARALKQGDLGEAGRQQEKALRDLRRGAERMSNEATAKRAGRGGEQGDPQAGGERDPLGRQMGAAGDGGAETAVPTETERQRAREILDELRRRAQDTQRPEAEREYLRRLLDRFTGS